MIAANPANITNTPSANATTTPLLGETLYTVKEGDTLGNIAVKFKVDSDILAAYNKLTNSDILRVDQTLRIPPPNYTPIVTY